MLFSIHPINLFRSLSLALELSSGGMSRHHWRTAMICSRIAEGLRLDEWQHQLLVYSALLHDIGAASHWEEKKRLQNQDVDNGIYKHAENGYELLKDSSQLGILAKTIRHHHDCWDGSSPSGLAGKSIPLNSRIICLADRMEISIKEGLHVFEQRQDILTYLRKYSGTLFDPELVTLVHEITRQESFWLDLANPHYYNNFFQDINQYGHMRFHADDVVNIAEIFATIIDRTSAFTGTHSRSVSMLAAYLGKARGFSSDEIRGLKVSGLLHDLGKLAIPNQVLEKPGKLTDWEFAMVKQHTYYTYRILEQIDGFSQIAQWAAFHHETLDGAGYPFRIKEEHFNLGSRIVAVADVFAALTENRPYRKPLPCSKVEEIMSSMVNNRKLDGTIVSDLFGSCQEAYGMVQSISYPSDTHS